MDSNFNRQRGQTNAYYEVLPFLISTLAIFGAFQLLSNALPKVTNFLRVLNNVLRNITSNNTPKRQQQKCTKSKNQPKVKQLFVKCTQLDD